MIKMTNSLSTSMLKMWDITMIANEYRHGTLIKRDDGTVTLHIHYHVNNVSHCMTIHTTADKLWEMLRYVHRIYVWYRYYYRLYPRVRYLRTHYTCKVTLGKHTPDEVVGVLEYI